MSMRSYFGLTLVAGLLLGGCSSDQAPAVPPGPPGPPNVAPVANAGADTSVHEGLTVVLDGSQSADADGTIAAYAWTQVDGPAVELGNADQDRASFTAPPVDGDTALRFRLQVTDDDQATAADEVIVMVLDAAALLPPTARAGADQTEVAENAAVTLDGSASSDADGSIAAYEWTQTGGPAVVLTGADTASAGFTAPDADADQVLEFRLTVTDDDGLSGSDTVAVTVRDQVPVRIEANDADGVPEGATARFTITLQETRPGAVIVRYATEDLTATAGADYVAAEGSVRIGPHETQATLEVATTQDAVDEFDETFRVELVGVAGAGTSPETRATATIRDDDADLLRVGAARRSITPSDAHIAGMTETRLGGQAAQQRFHLGGFGFGPFDAFGPFNEFIANPPAERAYHCKDAFARPDAPLACADALRERTWVRVLSVAQADGEAVLFVNVDAVGAGNVIQKDMKAAIEAATGVAPDNILIGQTHSHAGADLQGLWGGVPQDWVRQTLYAQAAAAAAAAQAGARPATLNYAVGRDGAWNNYRRPRYDREASADELLSVLQARAVDGTVLGTMVQYAAHPTAIGTGSGGALGRAVHADYPLGIEDTVEAATGAPAIYFNGPIADASGSGPTEGGDDYARVHSRGTCIARSALSLLDPAAATPCAASELDPGQARRVTLAPTLEVAHKTAVLPVTNPAFVALGAAGAFNRYYDFTELPLADIPGVGPQLAGQQSNLPQLTPTASTLVSRVTLGAPASGLEIVTIPGEATNTFGRYIRGLAATPNMMLLGLTQNSFGYILPEEEFNYLNPDGDAGFVLPFTGYEEFVSLGPLTAPLLRLQAYNPLFGVPEADPRNLPPFVTACEDSASELCAINNLGQRVDYIQRAYAGQCRDNGLPEEFCATIDPQTPLEQQCREAGFAPALCDALGSSGGEPGPGPGSPVAALLNALAAGCRELAADTPFEALCGAIQQLADAVGGASGDADPALVLAAIDTQARGCDFLDPSNCLYPFPNDWFTAPAAEGSIQAAPRGTGRRVNIHPAATPRNSAGKPVDPTEWNRSDGFSPGALIATYVPGLSLERTFGLPAHEIGVANVALSQHDDAPILVLEVPDDGAAPRKHLVWSEIDQNANLLTVAGVPNVGTFPVEGATNEYGHVARPGNDGRAALLIRPAKNFAEGKRYVVVLRGLKDQAGQPIPPQAGFRACVEGGSPLPPVQARCAQLEDRVFDVLHDAGIALDESVYLAWDFTVESTESAIGRLRHIRDDAFKSLSADPAGEDCTELTAANAATCAAPQVTVTGTLENPQSGIARRIEGTITVPNYLAPIGPSPLDNPYVSTAVNQFCANAPEGEFASGCRDLRDAIDLGQGLALPNRLFYSPADGAPAPDPTNPFDPTGLRYGDGLPDQNGTMTARFLCQVPAQASGDNPARASLYGHGQLDRGVAITYEGTPDVAREHNFMFCAVDWFGFRTGDAANVLTALVDLSNFPVIPDASQQGMLNFMFLARAMKHPQGFAALPEFQDDRGRPVFDRSEILYNGNSQGGIFGGVVLAASKDVNRGVLGSLGMNYSTLLTRSKNFDEYAGLLYNSYTDPLDRQLLFSMMQMLWDRSENNGYASHLVDNAAFGGPTNVVKLDPMFGDPQVTMYSAEVMARTMGVPYDNRQTLKVETLGSQYLGVNGRRHPAVEPYVGLAPLDYGDPAQTAGSALIVWDTNHAGEYAEIPPITNTAPRTGKDPHDASQKARYGRCHMAHFLARGELIDILPIQFEGQACPPIAPPPPTSAGEAPPAEPDPVGDLVDALQNGGLIAAINAVLAPLQQAVADALAGGAQQAGAAAGLALPPPAAKPAPTLAAPLPLQAGVAKRVIQVPVGTPLGGYLRPPVGGEYIGDDPEGELLDNLPGQADGCDPEHPESCPPLAPLPDEARAAHSPYATYSPPSRGYYDSLIAKAVALYDGTDYIVLVKTDFIGMLDEVVQDVKAQVKARKGIDLGDGLIMSATHTHDGPGALANHSTRYFWLAMDLYQHDVYRRLVGQLADVVVASLDNLKPARLGHGNGLDAEGLNKFRRGRFARYADDDVQDGDGLSDAEALRKRIGVLRVDDAASGRPMAVVINYALHGIAFDVENQYFSGDVLGAIEREVEQSFAAEAGSAAPIAMLVQNTGGDVTPTGVPYDIRGIEMLGKRMAPQVRGVVDAISRFQSAPDLRAVSQRIVLNRERLGYAENEYPYAWGAGQCGNDLAVPFADVGVRDIPGYEDSGLPVKHPYCIFSPPPDPIDLADNGVAENGAFYPQDTILAAAQLGDITLMVQPGEPLTEYGVRLMEAAAAEGYAATDTFIWGYAGDHIGYILPPEEDDWATFGGAESTTTFWGWKQGARFLEVNRSLLRSLRDGTAAPTDEFTVNYDLYKPLYEAMPAAVATPSAFPGAPITQPRDIRRFDTARFVFEGGDPVLDLPAVEMQTLAGGQWQPVRRANGEKLDTFFEMHLQYRLVTGRHLWTVVFEAPKDWATGSYRFAVRGQASQGATQDYALASAPFAVAVATTLQAGAVQCAGGVCTAALNYTPQPANYRVIDADVEPDQAAPVRNGRATFSNGTVSVEVEDGNGDGVYQAAIGGTVTVSGVDAHGNRTPGGGAPAPDQDGDGVPDGADACPTQAGPASNEGCPAEGGAGFPVRLESLCDPFGVGCASDLPGADAVQGALDTAWNTVVGGGAPPQDVLPDQCEPVTGENCLSDLPPPAGELFGEGGGGEPPDAGAAGQLVADAAGNAQTLPENLAASLQQTADNAAAGTLVQREAEAVVLEGRAFADWSQPAAQGIAMPYPNGALVGERDAHAGVLLYPPAGFAGLPTAAPVGEIVAYKREAGAWIEIPVQIDERFPYFLANPNSDFGIYSGTDMELTYAWDRETWKATGVCEVDEASVAPTPDPVPGLDDDDEVVFMARDAGEAAAPTDAAPEGTIGAGQEIALADPLAPGVPKFVYLFRKPAGPTFSVYYVDYRRDANADQWIDRSFFEGAGPEADPLRRNALGTSNTGYGPNLSGTVCWDGVTQRNSSDRFPRDGMTVSTDQYQLYASGRWMVRDVRIAKPGQDRVYGADLVDRWKGRAFQQSPDSTISVVGFEDEQVNWEANSALLGERLGPVRAIREVWGADSGTNVTKTETYYRDAYSYRYRVRVHPIPPDGLYTSWDYNRGAMVPGADENVAGGRYYTALRGRGVPIDGVNDDVGNVDGVAPVAGQCMTEDGPQPAANFGGVCPLFFDMADPALNLPLAMYNWEQVSGKGDTGSLVYMFELKSPTIGANAAAVPYYRDDACLDDGTGDDPVARPFPGERSTDSRVVAGYAAAAGKPYAQLSCEEKQGAHAQHGVHFFAPPESDNLMQPVPVDEIDGQQWAFAVPTATPTNVGERYANVLRVPLVRSVRPRPVPGG